MRCLVQRVTSAKVTVVDHMTGEIGQGALLLVCAMQGDEEANATKLAQKVMKLRIFADEAGKMNKSLLDIGGEALIVSQFTLAADTSRGNRPGFSSAAAPERGEELYEFFCERVRAEGVTVAKGEYAADMQVSLVNDGPTTIWMEF